MCYASMDLHAIDDTDDVLQRRALLVSEARLENEML